MTNLHLKIPCRIKPNTYFKREKPAGWAKIVAKHPLHLISEQAIRTLEKLRLNKMHLKNSFTCNSLPLASPRAF